MNHLSLNQVLALIGEPITEDMDRVNHYRNSIYQFLETFAQDDPEAQLLTLAAVGFRASTQPTKNSIFQAGRSLSIGVRGNSSKIAKWLEIFSTKSCEMH